MHWSFRTRLGTFFIAPRRDGQFELVFQDEDLGCYATTAMAADDAGGGHHYSLSCFPHDGETLGVARDISEWVFHQN